jgi:hypothetical protein
VPPEIMGHKRTGDPLTLLLVHPQNRLRQQNEIDGHVLFLPKKCKAIISRAEIIK